MEKLTIHRGLAELKLITARIESGTNNLVPIGLYQKDKPVNNVTEKSAFESKAVADYQSVIDLITRRNKIKSAIVMTNATTKVKIASKEMTIAEAIDLKTAISFKKSLLENLRKKLSQAKMYLEKNNVQVDGQALKLAEVALGKQGIKIGDNDVKNVTEPYLLANTFYLSDPLGLDKKITDLDKEIGDFEAEVDATLSEVNATTFIEI